MKNIFFKSLSLVLVLLFAFVLSACGGNNDDSGDDDIDIKDDYGDFTITTDVTDGYTVDSATNTYTITVSGEYTIKGLLKGRIVFDSSLSTKCTLILDGVYLEYNTDSVIYWASESKKVEIIVREGTTNYIVQGKWDGDTSSACIESNNNVEVSGYGTLNLISEQKHGIKGSDVTVSGSVILNITASSDGLHGKTIAIEGGTITIEASSDGIEAELNSSSAKGTITISNCTLNLKSCNVAIKAATSITIGASEVTTNVVIASSSESNFSVPDNGLAIENASVMIDGVSYTA